MHASNLFLWSRDELFCSLRYGQKLLTWTKKTVSFKKSRDELFISGIVSTSVYVSMHDVPVKCFHSTYVEMGVEAV